MDQRTRSTSADGEAGGIRDGPLKPPSAAPADQLDPDEEDDDRRAERDPGALR